MNLNTRLTDRILIVTAVALLSGLAGCSGGDADFEVARVDGKITYEGQVVKGGSITFRPVRVVSTRPGMKGKPATAAVQDDGTFVLSTYGEKDGAVVGQHEVMYTPTHEGAKSYENKPKPSPYAGLVPKTKMVEIQLGRNAIDIELVTPGQRSVQ